MSESSAYRSQAWGGCYAGAEGGDATLQLELGGLDIARTTFNLDVVITCYISHHLRLPAALQLHLVPSLYLTKAVI